MTAPRTPQRTGRALRVASVVMWSIAVAGTAAGVIGDSRGWWGGRAFVTNLLSSFVGAMFGVPLALLVIQRIAAAENQRRDRWEVVQSAAAALQLLADDLASAVPAKHLALDLQRALDDLRRELLPQVQGHRFDPALERVLRTWLSAQAAISSTVDTSMPGFDALSDARATWRFLSHHEAPRLLAYRFRWISGLTAKHIDTLFDEVERFLVDNRRADRDRQIISEALEQRSTVPLVALYEDEYSIFPGLREDIDRSWSGVCSIIELLDAIEELAAQLRRMPA